MGVAFARQVISSVDPVKNVVEYYWAVDKCPYCKGHHLHGAGRDPERVAEYLGLRLSHCFPQKPAQYQLKERMTSLRGRKPQSPKKQLPRQ